MIAFYKRRQPQWYVFVAKCYKKFDPRGWSCKMPQAQSHHVNESADAGGLPELVCQRGRKLVRPSLLCYPCLLLGR